MNLGGFIPPTASSSVRKSKSGHNDVREITIMTMTGPSECLVPVFFEAVFADVANHYPPNECCAKDRDYVLLRLKAEGNKFAFMTLPTLGKAIESSLITLKPFVLPDGFSRSHDTALPRFLNWLMISLFQDDGTPRWTMESLACHRGENAMLNDVISRYRDIRQITMAFSKVEDCFSERDFSQKLKAFIERVGNLKDPDFTSGYLRALVRESRMILRSCFPSEAAMARRYGFWREYLQEPYGRHGPGAVAGREKGRQKWAFSYIPGINPRLYSWRPEGFPFRSKAEPYARMIAVPKDFRGPRIICIEPKEFQFAQQGLMELLYKTMHASPVLRTSLDMLDTSASRALCYRSDTATIDLKDASDNISLRLVKLLFPTWMYKLLTRYRSRGLKHEGVLPYKSFATMGSAVCFPVESLVFWVIARSAMNLRGHPRDTLRVFGDDVGCTKRNFSCISEAYSLCGFILNPEKTCHETPIRESCGEYTFWLRPCMITRFKTTNTSAASNFMAFLDYARNLNDNEYVEASRQVLRLIEKVHPVPYGTRWAPPLMDNNCPMRWNRDLQHWECRLPLPILVDRVQPLTDFARLYAWQVGNSLDPSFRGTVKVKRKWTAAD